MLPALLLALAVQSTVAPVIAPGAPFRIAFEHDGAEDARYRLWCNNGIVKNWVTADLTRTGTTVEAMAPGLPRGSHSCFVSAWNESGEAKSEPIVIPVGTVPAVPVQLRIVVTVK